MYAKTDALRDREGERIIHKIHLYLQPKLAERGIPPRSVCLLCGPRIASSQHILHPILIVNQIHIQYLDAAATVSDL